MTRRTRLYQAPRSPLIQGRSSRERPLWQPWLGGFLLGFAALLGWSWSVSPRLPSPAGLAAMAAVCAVGALLGALLARAWGLHRRWLAAGAAAVVLFAVVWFALAGIPLGRLMGMRT